MKIVLLVFHLFIAAGLSILILVQSSKGGLGTAFGGGGSYHSKRGAEQVIFRATVIATILFFLTSVALVLVP